MPVSWVLLPCSPCHSHYLTTSPSTHLMGHHILQPDMVPATHYLLYAISPHSFASFIWMGCHHLNNAYTSDMQCLDREGRRRSDHVDYFLTYDVTLCSSYMSLHGISLYLLYQSNIFGRDTLGTRRGRRAPVRRFPPPGRVCYAGAGMATLDSSTTFLMDVWTSDRPTITLHSASTISSFNGMGCCEPVGTTEHLPSLLASAYILSLRPS